MMRVLQVAASSRSDGGGVTQSMLELASSLKAHHISPEVHSLETHGTEIPSGGVKVHSHPITSRFPFPSSKSLAAALSRDDCALYHTHGLWTYPSVAVPRAATKTGRPWLVSPHGMLDDWALRNSRAKKRIATFLFEKRHLRQAACIHALCEAEAESIREFGLKKPICIIPNGVQLPKETDTDTSQQSTVKTLLFLGRLHPKKGIENAIRAWASIPVERREDWRFVIAGWDQAGHAEHLIRVGKELNLRPIVNTGHSKNAFPDEPDSIHFTGPVFGQEKDTLLRSASAFLLPSYSEGLPVAVLEAWAYKLPVLMTPACNLQEGFVTNAAIQIESSSDSIKEGLIALMERSDKEREEIGKNGRTLVEEKFAWDSIAREMKSVYEWIVEGKAEPDSLTKQ